MPTAPKLTLRATGYLRFDLAFRVHFMNCHPEAERRSAASDAGPQDLLLIEGPA